MSENRYLIAGGLGGAAGVMVYLLGDNLVMTLISGVAIFIIFSIMLKATPPAPAATAPESLPGLLREGDEALQAIAYQARQIKDEEVHEKAGEICQTVERVLSTLKEQPGDIPKVRKFFSYYLPTLKKLLTSYGNIEKSGVPQAGLRQKLLGHLKSILSAMRKLHENLYQNEMLDLSVEMQAMTASCIQDGLLTPEDFSFHKDVGA